MEKLEAAHRVKARAAELGFDACGIAEAGPIDPEGRLKDWIRRGFHAEMDWMARTADIRADVRLKVPGAKSVVVVARSYYSAPPKPPASSALGHVSRYAWGRDYHRVLQKPLRALADTIREMDGAPLPHTPYICVDSGPVLERAWAVQAGLGWIGKNGLLIREGLGSWFFLGVVVTTVELSHDAPIANRCGTCTLCMDACPTGALIEPGVLDARCCISYHNKQLGEIPSEVQERMGNRLFGCDACQEACPWNQQIRETTEADFLPRPGLAYPDMNEWATADEAAFNDRTAGTPLRRLTWTGFRRNLHIAARNRAVMKKEDPDPSGPRSSEV